MSSRVVSALQTFIVLMAVWMALNGATAWWLGAAFAAAGAAVGATLAIGDPYPWRPLRLIVFVGYFIRILVQGATDVALRALHPRLPLQPHLQSHELRVPSGQPRTLLLAIVNLVPGSLSADIEGDTLTLHALSDESAATFRDLEQRIAWIFSLEDQV